jgi:hypothetical protein
MFFVTNSYDTNPDTREKKSIRPSGRYSYTNITLNHAVQEENPR